MLYLAAAYTDLTVCILKTWLQSRLQARGPLVLWITSLTSLRIQTTTKQKWGDTECVWKVWMPSRLIKVQSSDRTCFYSCYFISTSMDSCGLSNRQLQKKKPQLHQQIWKRFHLVADFPATNWTRTSWDPSHTNIYRTVFLCVRLQYLGEVHLAFCPHLWV